MPAPPFLASFAPHAPICQLMRLQGTLMCSGGWGSNSAQLLDFYFDLLSQFIYLLPPSVPQQAAPPLHRALPDSASTSIRRTFSCLPTLMCPFSLPPSRSHPPAHLPAPSCTCLQVPRRPCGGRGGNGAQLRVAAPQHEALPQHRDGEPGHVEQSVAPLCGPLVAWGPARRRVDVHGGGGEQGEEHGRSWW